MSVSDDSTHPIGHLIAARADEISANLPVNPTPQEIVNAAWAICMVPKHKIVLQAGYDHPAMGGAFGFSIVVTLRAGREAVKVVAMGATPADALRDLPRALASAAVEPVTR